MSSNVLVEVSVFSLLLTALTVGPHAHLLPCSRCRDIILPLRLGASAVGGGIANDGRLFDGRQLRVFVEEGKVEDTQTLEVGLVGRRLDDAVNGWLDVLFGP